MPRRWASTVFVQWPLESALSEGQFSLDLMTRLLRTDWLRKLLLLEAPLALFMAHRVLETASAVPSRDLAWR